MRAAGSRSLVLWLGANSRHRMVQRDSVCRQGLLGVSLYLIHVWLLCRGHIADRSEAQILCIKFKLRFTSPGRILDPNICVVEVGCQEVPHEAPCAELPSDVVLAS